VKLRAAASLLLSGLVSLAGNYDLIIRDGRVVDGTGAPAMHADIAVADGRIARIGKISGEAAREIDATGLIVAPGFIDVHTHAEEIVEMPEGENFIRMGVTTLMLGNCGSSAEVGDLLRKVEASGTTPNVATLVGHNTVRRKAMGGSFDREPTAEELAAMRAQVRAGMEEGAFGLSTGLIYLPGTFSKTDEIVELAKVASEFGGIYASHMRDEGLAIESALAEVFRIAREAKIRAHVSHIKLSGKSAWNRAAEILAVIEKARAEGLDITQDQYLYTASSTDISQLVPEWAREGGGLKARLAKSETNAAIRQEMRARLKRRGFDDYSYAAIANYAKDSELNGLNVAQAAAKKLGDDSLEKQIELVLEIVSEGGASGVFHGIGEDDLRVFLAHPNTMFAADSAVRRFGHGVPHPRGYGNNARVLGRYVNELGLLRMEEAIRKMTSLPAVTFRIRERGLIQEGFWADLVIFDPRKVRDRATFAEPHQYAEGFQYVLVNGVPVVEKSEFMGKRPGKALRRE
jgi:N-acyl-D-amino-acid deacylase